MNVTLGALAVGSIVRLNENGIPVDYLIVQQGRPSSIYDTSCDGTWLLRQDVAENRVWDDGNVNKLEYSDIHTYLNGTWLNRYDANIKFAIKQVKIPYRQNGGSGGTDHTGANGLSCKIFLLSGYEVGWTTGNNPYFPVDGAKLAYFESGNSISAYEKRVAKLNGSVSGWLARSPYTDNTYDVWQVSPGGGHGLRVASNSSGIRPALILPRSLSVSGSGAVSTSLPAMIGVNGTIRGATRMLCGAGGTVRDLVNMRTGIHGVSREIFRR